ncbi:MAG: DsrE family protein [Planctomycetales bacterium]|nr:DsrE family protein [Planctomycetales bacterium]
MYLKTWTWVVIALLTITASADALAQGPGRGFGGPGGPGGPGRGPGRGRGFGPGAGAGGGHDERHVEDHDVFHFLLENHEKITRTVKQLPNGVESLTESDDPAVVAKLKDHVKWMEYRIEKTNPIRMRDPLFAEIFRHTDKISMKRVETEKGVKVIETSDDPYVAKLIKAHAEVVSGFVNRGFDEAMKNHAVPANDAKPVAAESATFSNPVIAKYGKVAQLPAAAQQPRDGAKIVVDLTKGNDPHELNPAIEKLARFVNIYAGAGKTPAKLHLAVVLHGDATLAVLNTDAYSARFQTEGNPNLDCLHQLHEAGVEIYVCGQSLIGKHAKPEQVVVFADVAVSALTSLANLQTDGYTYLPLLK